MNFMDFIKMQLIKDLALLSLMIDVLEIIQFKMDLITYTSTNERIFFK